MDIKQERLLLQICVTLAGFVAVATGLAGVALGQEFLVAAPFDSLLDSQLRALSGLLLAVGLLYWSMIPEIEKHALLFSRLTMIVMAGGLARLYGVLIEGPPPAPMLFGLGMELIVAPALWLWHWRVERRWAEVMEGLK